jgi:Domain of unknown function (DUF4326)
MQPVRIQRRRTKGFNLQEVSLAANGLPCVFVGRPTRFGNPYRADVFGLDLSLQLYRETVNGAWSPSLLKHLSDELCDAAYTGHLAFLARFGREHPGDAAKSDLRGKNLSCYCGFDHGCHVDTLLQLANGGRE